MGFEVVDEQEERPLGLFAFVQEPDREFGGSCGPFVDCVFSGRVRGFENVEALGQSASRRHPGVARDPIGRVVACGERFGEGDVLTREGEIFVYRIVLARGEASKQRGVRWKCPGRVRVGVFEANARRRDAIDVGRERALVESSADGIGANGVEYDQEYVRSGAGLTASDSDQGCREEEEEKRDELTTYPPRGGIPSALHGRSEQQRAQLTAAISASQIRSAVASSM